MRVDTCINEIHVAFILMSPKDHLAHLIWFQLDLYVAGFSCKPFSMLHVNTQLLMEEQARIFYAVFHRIGKVQPATFVLENVPGISRCVTEVLAQLRSQGYHVLVHLLNPKDLHEPLNRPRYYFVGVRRNLALVDETAAQRIYEHVWVSLKQSRSSGFSDATVPLRQRILTSDHVLVKQYQALRLQRGQEAKDANFVCGGSQGQKWKQRHQEWQEKRSSNARQLNPPLPDADELYLHLPRERDAWKNLLQFGNLPKQPVADLSQSLGRIPVQSGCLPTTTPGSNLVVASERRMLTPMEKLLLRCLPVVL